MRFPVFLLPPNVHDSYHCQFQYPAQTFHVYFTVLLSCYQIAIVTNVSSMIFIFITSHFNVVIFYDKLYPQYSYIQKFFYCEPSENLCFGQIIFKPKYWDDLAKRIFLTSLKMRPQILLVAIKCRFLLFLYEHIPSGTVDATSILITSSTNDSDFFMIPFPVALLQATHTPITSPIYVVIFNVTMTQKKDSP